MPHAAARPGDNRYYSLDLWRGVACLMVVVYHASFYSLKPHPPAGRIAGPIYRIIAAGELGVPVFFVISGYCIAAACDNLRSRTGGAGRYFYRRVRRIFPPYWIAFAAFAVGAVLLAKLGHGGLYTDANFPVPNPATLSPGRWLGNLTLTETWRFPIFDGVGNVFAGFFLSPAWTLCYEEQFYAVCGLALFASRRHFFGTVAVVTAAVLAVSLWRPIPGLFCDGKWLTFAAGVAVYYRLQHARRGWPACAIEACLIAFLIFGLFVRRAQVYGPTGEYAVGTAFALLILALHRWDVPVRDARILRPLAACGTMCYSLYLVHWPVVKVLSHGLYLAGVRGPWPTLAVTEPICLAAAVAVGWAFHVTVERRFLNPPSARTPAADPVAGEATA